MHGQKTARAQHLLDQRGRAAHAFLRRLEEQAHIARQARCVPPQQSGQPQAQGRMPVVAAGVAETGVAGGETLPRREMPGIVGLGHFQGVQIKTQHQIRLPAGMQIRHKPGGRAHALKPAGVGAFLNGPLPRPLEHGRGGQAHALVRIEDFAAHARGIAQGVQDVRRKGRGPEFRPARFGMPVQLAPPGDQGRRQFRIRSSVHGRCPKSTGTRTRCAALLVNSR